MTITKTNMPDQRNTPNQTMTRCLLRMNPYRARPAAGRLQLRRHVTWRAGVAREAGKPAIIACRVGQDYPVCRGHRRHSPKLIRAADPTTRWTRRATDVVINCNGDPAFHRPAQGRLRARTSTTPHLTRHWLAQAVPGSALTVIRDKQQTWRQQSPRGSRHARCLVQHAGTPALISSNKPLLNSPIQSDVTTEVSR